MEQNVIGKDLTKEAPRSPKTRVGDYVILGRTLDKCRALLAGNIGEYHFDCPLDNMLFGWKGIGKITVDALEKLDYPVVMGSVLVTAGLFVTVNILADILYSVIDPRIGIN